MSKGGGGGAQYYPMPTVQASNSATSSSTSIPQWLTDASQFGVQNAQNIVKQGTPQYNGPLAVGMAGDQTAAGNLIRNSVGAYQPYYDAAQGAINNSMTRLQPQTLANGLTGISQYMNPYIDNVVNSVQDISRQNLDSALTQTADKALAAKAFGGSRHGVQEGVATAQNNLNTNNLIANLLSSGYNQAANMLGTDVQAQNQAAQQNNANALAGGQALSNLGTANRAANTADINNLMTYGGLEQQTAQNAADKLYGYFQYQNQYPLQAQQMYNQTVAAAPHNTSQTGSLSTNTTTLAPQQQTSSSPLLTGLGGLMGLGSMFAAPAGGTSAAAGLLGAAKAGLALLPALSDKDMKTDIKKLGKDEETGLDIYSYRYKGDPKTYPKVVGPMAQDIEKEYPGVTRRKAGKITVDPAAMNILAGKFINGENYGRGLL